MFWLIWSTYGLSSSTAWSSINGIKLKDDEEEKCKHGFVELGHENEMEMEMEKGCDTYKDVCLFLWDLLSSNHQQSMILDLVLVFFYEKKKG